MVYSLALLQLGIPLALIALHATVPAAGLVSLVLRTAAIALVVLYSAIAGIWLFPPWWTPWAMGVLLLAATVPAARRWWTGRGAALPWQVVDGLLAVALGAFAVHMLLPALNGRAPQPDAVALAHPLEPGTYLVLSGGHELAINAHLMTLAPQFGDYLGQSYGVDLIAIDGLGLRAEGIAPEAPQDYFVFGRRILAPCAGSVVAAVDGLPDMPAGQRDRTQLAGNHVIVDCDGVHVVLGHMTTGSVRVSAGDAVAVGDVLGLVGNSGNTDEPHLHIHAQTPGSPDAPLNGQPLPIRIEGRTLVRNEVVEWR